MADHTHGQTLLVVSCSDSLYWYRCSIGKAFPLLRDAGQDWLSREHSGLTNIIDKRDAVVIPSGYSLVEPSGLMQRADLMLVELRWAITTPGDWGRPVGSNRVIRSQISRGE